jgi:nucleoside-diphosphate-sugar epimerase
VNKLLFLGVGTVARAVRAELPNHDASGTTRREPDARFHDIAPIAVSDLSAIREAAAGAKVVVSFPPDGSTDRELSALVSEAASIAYLSSTAVYPSAVAVVNEATPAAPDSGRARARLDAESLWLEAGASVVRLPAFYGPETGLHLSLTRGTFRMPGRGDNVVSRVHVADAARFVLAALSAPARSLLLAGDDEPAPVADVVGFVCSLFELPLPPTAEGDDIPLSLRASRTIDNSATKARYGIRLAYPTYREGYRAIRESQPFTSG